MTESGVTNLPKPRTVSASARCVAFRYAALRCAKLRCAALYCTALRITLPSSSVPPPVSGIYFAVRYGTESTQSIDAQGRAREVAEVQKVTSLSRRARRTSSNPTYTISTPRFLAFIIPPTHAPPSHPVSHFIQSGIPVRCVRPSNWHPPRMPLQTHPSAIGLFLRS
ncbi:hypothetical protein LY76DRAFT_377927 [Colletotrichum caudatum]|nr:hypothetical protein LY76DRAFT_377927 [Colletotrichum caudatum]